MTGNPRIARVYNAPYLQNEFGDPQIFFTFLTNLIMKKSVRGNFWARASLSQAVPVEILEIIKN